MLASDGRRRNHRSRRGASSSSSSSRHQHTLPYWPRVNSSFMACLRPLNPHVPLSSSRPGSDKNSPIASSGSVFLSSLAL